MSASEPKNTAFYNDLVIQEKMAREQQIAFEGLKIIRDRLADCVHREGVNKFENCKEISEKYLALSTDRYRGMIFPEGREPENRQLPGLNIPK